MNTLLAHPWNDGGPGPWILLFPVMWAILIGGFVFFMRRVVFRGGRGPWQRRSTGYAENSPIAILGRRFAAGEMDEDEYWRRMSVLNEEFGMHRKDGAA